MWETIVQSVVRYLPAAEVALLLCVGGFLVFLWKVWPKSSGSDVVVRDMVEVIGQLVGGLNDRIAEENKMLVEILLEVKAGRVELRDAREELWRLEERFRQLSLAQGTPNRV